MKVVSGAQTGVDRAALDAALDCGVSAGGWCPEGREAEDGTIPIKYPVKELEGGGYRQRTKRNIIDSDGTVIIYYGYPAGGTELTIFLAIKEKKPYLLIDALEISQDRAAKKVREFIETNKIICLNVAGPRASREPEAYGYTKKVLLEVLQKCP